MCIRDRCASRAFDPHKKTKSVCSASSYELVLPPAPKIVVRPTTEGACQVRLQLSTLLLPKTCRANFDARKLTSFVDLEQLNIPVAVRPFLARLRRNPSAARSRASSQDAGRSRPLSRTRGWVRRGYAPGGFERFFTCISNTGMMLGGCNEARTQASGHPNISFANRHAACTPSGGQHHPSLSTRGEP